MKVSWPDERKFAFTVFDDTDWATIRLVKPVYDMLLELDMKTTKSVWIHKGQGAPIHDGMTCESREYLDWILGLKNQGFEIGLHNAAPSTSSRDMTALALDRFRELFGDRKIIHTNHVGCLENIYWGDKRISGWRRIIYNLMTRGKRRNISQGQVVGDPLFWGDLCQERVRYVRSFVFSDLNSLALCPEIPYHDPSKSFVNFWFVSSNAGSLKRFLENFTIRKIDRLVDDGGLCIVYTHFAAGFAKNGELDIEFRKRMEYIATRNGWFVPVSDILDHLRSGEAPSNRIIPRKRLLKLETRWLRNQALSQFS